MPIELGSFDAIIGKDWLAKYQGIIVCAKKIVRIPWGNETLIVPGDGSNQGHEALQETTEKTVQIKQRMQAACDQQKSYADLKRKPIEFQVGDKVMLKVLPWKGVVHFGKRGKLNPRYVGPFKVLEKVGEVAYKLELPKELSRSIGWTSL
ncbi:hypothetical protein Tco_0029158 [Tanacetum coccineum]